MQYMIFPASLSSKIVFKLEIYFVFCFFKAFWSMESSAGSSSSSIHRSWVCLSTCSGLASTGTLIWLADTVDQAILTASSSWVFLHHQYGTNGCSDLSKAASCFQGGCDGPGLTKVVNGKWWSFDRCRQCDMTQWHQLQLVLLGILQAEDASGVQGEPNLFFIQSSGFVGLMQCHGNL